MSRESRDTDKQTNRKLVRARNLIETEAIIVAYAMSRLDDLFLKRFGFSSWHRAFSATGDRLGVRPASMKNLRDEFDPIHPNGRRGWHKRPLRPNRQRILGEFCDSSDEAMIDIISRLLAGDKEVEKVVVKPLASARDPVANVAERLRTGRLAETYFMENSESICGISAKSLLDCRYQACGFDFGVHGRDLLAIEVKGLKTMRGGILFTDAEWNQANRREDNYWLIVVGGLERHPRAMVVKHPAISLTVTSSIRNVSAISWRANVSVGDKSA
jgi:Domain of unknown function (DUF3883)